MKGKNLLVLICLDEEKHPNEGTHVVDIPKAIKMLKADNLHLEIGNVENILGKNIWGEKKWEIDYQGIDPFSFSDFIGNSITFYTDKSQKRNYLIGVYDRTNIKHMQAMIHDFARYRERQILALLGGRSDRNRK